MANILSLAMKISADASGVVKNLTPAERALEKLGAEAAKTTAVFDKFAKDSAAAAAAQGNLNARFDELAKQLAGGLDPKKYAEGYAQLQDEVRRTSEAFEEGVRVTRELRTEQEIHAERMARLTELARIGAIGEETFARGVAQADAALAKASKSADSFADDIDRAGSSGLKFNELSGILAALPGPLGNIAGRFSGIASAAEGLNRVFNGGLRAGFASLGTTLVSLVNPITASIAAFGALSAGSVAVGRSLVQLEGEVERLGQLADRLGVSFNFVQVLEAAADETGSSVEALGGSFTKFLRTVNEARNGTKSAVAAFKDLRISADDVRDGDPEALFTRTAEALLRLPDPAQRTATAMALFGKSGAELLPVLKQLGTAAIDLERIGGALTEQQRADLDAFGDAMDRVGIASDGLWKQITANFAGIGKSVSDSTAESIGGLNRFIRSLDDTASDKTFAGFEKTQARLEADAAILRQRNDVIEESNRLASVNALAAFVASLDQSIDGAINLTGEIAKAQAEAAAFGEDGSKAVSSLVKSLEDVAVAAEDAGYSEEQLAAAQKLAFADFAKRVDLLKEQADLQERASKVASNAVEQESAASEKAIESIREQLSLAINDSARFGQAGFDAAVKYQTAIADLEKQFGQGIINLPALKANAAAVAAEYQKQADAFAVLAELQKSILVADKQRLDSLVASQADVKQAESDIEFVLRQQKSLSEEIAKARRDGNVIQAAAASARLAQLDQLQTKLEEQQQALDQGFGDGFKKSFDSIDADITTIIEKATEFGNVGAIAAQQLEEGIAKAKEQAKDGILTKDTLDAEKDRLTALFEQQLQAAQNVRALLLEGLNEEQQARIQAVEQEQAARVQAAKNVAAIELEISAAKQAVEQARDNGDLQAARAGILRISQLEDVARREQDIADGRIREEQGIASLREQQVQQQQKAEEAFAKQQQQAMQAYAQEQQRIYQEQQKAAEAEAKRQEDRLRKLNTLGQTSVQTADIRTQEGAALVLGIANAAQDPAAIQARLQTKLLEKIALGIGQAASNYFNQPVAIVGYSQVGGIN
jgi:hypothetical protein